MIPHATYHAANPLPAVVRCCQPTAAHCPPPQFGAGRVHMIDAFDRPQSANIASQDDYIAALSKTAWRDSAYLAESLDIDRDAVKRRMLDGPMAELTKRKKMSGKWVWKLLP